jgi:hypothetical protein
MADHIRALGDDGLQGALLWVALSSLTPSAELTFAARSSEGGHGDVAPLPPLRLDDVDAALQHRLNQPLTSSASAPFSSSSSALHDGLTLARRLILFSAHSSNENNNSNVPPAAAAAAAAAAPKPSASAATQTDAPMPLPPPPSTDSADEVPKRTGPFMTAKDKLALENPQKAALLKRESEKRSTAMAAAAAAIGCGSSGGVKGASLDDDTPLPPELAHCGEKALVEKILSEIVHKGQEIKFSEIAGLEFAKKTVMEVVCWPMSRPDLFTGLRALPRGVLLFGPPGTGKTLIGKAIAHQAGATFFSISASSLTSKWIGEGEKTVRALFAVAAVKQPSVVFIDEVDSLLCQRSSDENEASRRIKTEFLVQLDGVAGGSSADNVRVVIIGATNRPEELDEAARRRFVKRIYIPLPDEAGRSQLLATLLKNSAHELTQPDVDRLIAETDGFSGADIRSLCTEAALGPVREIAARCGNLARVRECDVPPITMAHFEEALEGVAASVSPADLLRYVDWNGKFGSYRRME